MADPGTLGGPASNGLSANDAGQVVDPVDIAGGRTRAFLSQGGEIADLGTLGGRSSLAHRINHRRRNVGPSEIATGARGPSSGGTGASDPVIRAWLGSGGRVGGGSHWCMAPAAHPKVTALYT